MRISAVGNGRVNFEATGCKHDYCSIWQLPQLLHRALLCLGTLQMYVWPTQRLEECALSTVVGCKDLLRNPVQGMESCMLNQQPFVPGVIAIKETRHVEHSLKLERGRHVITMSNGYVMECSTCASRLEIDRRARMVPCRCVWGNPTQ